MPYGLRIGPARPAADAALVERFRKIPVANISDSMFRIVAGGASLRPIGSSALCGIALTVRTAPGDNLFVHKALDLAQSGDVVVVDAGGDLTNAIIGERMLAIAAAKGLAGIVINGAIRDVDALANHPLPVFAAGVTHRGPYKNGPGEINFPIAIAGMVVQSGDIIVGDADGLVCVPAADAAAICDLAAAKFKHETDTDPTKESRAWVDDALSRLGVEYVS